MRTSDFIKTTEGSKYLLCDGSEIPSSYSKLRSLMTHTPDLRDRVPQGAGAYAVGTTIEAGIPNIYGHVMRFENPRWGLFESSNGAFYLDGLQPHLGINPYNEDSAHRGYGHLYLDSSRSSSIYKNDITTVQPPALAVDFYIKAK